MSEGVDDGAEGDGGQDAHVRVAPEGGDGEQGESEGDDAEEGIEVHLHAGEDDSEEAEGFQIVLRVD